MSSVFKTQCCIAGAGPAGLMLGYLLARAGVQVIVLEKHADFLRDFAATPCIPRQWSDGRAVRLLDRFLELPHNKVERMMVQFGDFRTEMADLTHLPVRAPYIAMMPQWDFLSFLAGEAQRYPSFHARRAVRGDGAHRKRRAGHGDHGDNS